MQIIVLMAGEGRRFTDVGITIPKPFIQVKGKTILEWTTRSCPYIRHTSDGGEKLHFAIRSEHESYIPQLRATYGNQINIHRFDKTTRGNLETALEVTRKLSHIHEDILILDSDNKYNHNDIWDTIAKADRSRNGMMVCGFDRLDDSTKWAFASITNGIVSSVIEKPPLVFLKEYSNLYPLVGTFWFSSVETFEAYARLILQIGLKTGAKQQEFFMSSIPDVAARLFQTVHFHKVTDVVPLGTPEDVELFRHD